MPVKIALLQHTPDPELAVALAARLCYSPIGIDELKERLSRTDVTAFLNKIMSLGHQSVLEHASFTFGIEGISRATSHQLVRHRLASYSQQSQRYVTHTTQFSAVTPPSIAARPDLAARFKEQLKALHDCYAELVEAGIPAEDTRYILPNAAETKVIITMNARELLHFFSLRSCNRAQWEIRAMSDQMIRLVKEIAPILFANAGPECLNGKCPEGEMCCGAPRTRAEFESTP